MDLDKCQISQTFVNNMSGELYLEIDRLETFTNNWPHDDDTLCSKSNMAKAGFFYGGGSDCVQCFVCHIAVNNWDPQKDEPMVKHQECSPTCMFARFGKEEGLLTVEQWLDVMNSRAINRLDQIFAGIVS